MIEWITQIDFNILNAIQGIRNEFLDTIVPHITFLGSGGAIWILISIILICFNKSRKTGVTVIVSLLLGLIFSTIILKSLVARERPFNSDFGLLNVDMLLIGAPSGRFSFPSGHSVSSFSAATILLAYNRKIGIPALLLAVAICFTRLYLYVHFPSDVVIGAILGILLALFSIFIVNKIWEKINERKLSNNSK